MGLTIHFNLTAIRFDGAAALRVVQALREKALSLDFQGVSDLQIDDTPRGKHNDSFGALYPGLRIVQTGRELPPKPEAQKISLQQEMTEGEIEAAAAEMIGQWEERRARRERGEDVADDLPDLSGLLVRATDGACVDVHPLQSIWFTASNEGAETLLVGLACYPATVVHELDGQPQTFETGLGVGWHWQGFCKTQYAGMPQAGGPEHFLRAHKAIVLLLDRVKELGVDLEVHDDSDYWNHRDDQALLAELRKWNSVMALLAGELKDRKLGVEGPIFSHPEFEHLEAEGDAAMKRLWERHKRREQDQSE